MDISAADLLPWVQTLGWVLLHFVWQGIVIGAAYACLRAFLSKNNATARYALGLGALAAMSLCTIATFVFEMPQPAQALAGSAAAAGVIDAVALENAVAPVEWDSSLLSIVDNAMPWLVLAWLVGVLWSARRTLRQWRRLDRIARLWAARDEAIEAILQNLVARFGFVRRIKVLVTDRIDTPTLIGWIKPVILLPTAVALGFPRQHVELILAHELGHLRRYDHIVNLVQALVETLLFYHPVVHWISRDVRNEREICCDNLVLHMTSGSASAYARALASLEEIRQPSPQLALAATGGLLLERVRRIVGVDAALGPAARPNRGAVLLLAAVVALAGSAATRIGGAVDLQVDAPQLQAVAPHLSLLAGDFVAHVAAPRKLRLSAPVVPVPAVPVANVVRVDAVAPPPREVVADAIAPAPIVSAQDLASELRGQKPLDRVNDVSLGEPVRLAQVSVATEPMPTHIVAPKYPAEEPSPTRSVQVALQFGVDRDGSVRDVKVVSTNSDEAFVRAARYALEQWRFSKGTLADPNVRYTQTFRFAKQDGVTDRHGCVTRTGSLVCRSQDDPVPAGVTVLADRESGRLVSVRGPGG